MILEPAPGFSAKCQGWVHGKQGVPIEANPFVPGTRKAKNWEAAWHVGRKLYEDKLLKEIEEMTR